MVVPFRFFLGLASGIALAFSTFLGFVYWQLGAATDLSYWAHKINLSKQASAASILSPKFLIIGGSGALFGIKARILESDLGIPTINLGTHAGLETTYILNLARKALRANDTVLLALEYELYEYDRARTSRRATTIFVDFVMARDEEYFHNLPLWDQYNLAMRMSFDRLKIGVKNKIYPPQVPVFPEFTVYDPKNVDEYGDMTGQTRDRIPSYVPAELKSFSEVLANGLSEEKAGLTEIRKFIGWANSNHVRVLATFPNLCLNTIYDSPKAANAADEIEVFYRSLGVTVIGSYRDAMLPRNKFFDTCYHLTEEAAVARTESLALLLRRHFLSR
jgi:hypothetical protein